MQDKVRIGVLGCGAISANYFRNAKNLPILEMAAVADLDGERAKARAEEFGVSTVYTPEELIAAPDIDIVLNLTVPAAHGPLALQCLEAGKHSFAEKPLAVDRAEGRRVVETVAAKGLRIGCAPDTFLGAGLQTARKALDEGAIGRPIGFAALMLGRGPEAGHPNPHFFYQPGGGPMFDMGPYYVTALLNLLGPVKRYTGLASVAIPERTITSQPLYGQKIQVNTPDHICGTLEFENGAVGSLITSFAVAVHHYERSHPITIFGTEGTMKVPDPNTFDGKVLVKRPGEEEWSEIPHAFLPGYGRSVGLADMAHALRSNRPHRCSAEQAFTTLDLMQGFLDSSREGKALTPTLAYQRPAPMPDLPFGTLD